MAIVMFAFIVGYLSTGSFGSVATAATKAVSEVPQMLGLSDVVSSLDELLSTSAGGKGKQSKAVVSRGVDGDTLEVELKSGDTADVRLLAYDTPESVRPGVSPECGSHRASLFTKRIAEGKPVKLVEDPTQDSVDRYGRLLRYAVIRGRDVGQRVIRAGWGAPYVFDSSNPPQKIDVYREAAAKAKAEGKGIWGMCGGNFHSESDEPWSGD